VQIVSSSLNPCVFKAHCLGFVGQFPILGATILLPIAF
jgi:hypothetical protein